METSKKLTQPLFQEETPYGYLKNIDESSDTPAHGLKKIPIQGLEKEEEMKVVQKEASLLKSLKHPNILPYTENYISKDTLFMCLKTDWISNNSGFFSFIRIGGSLSQELKQRNGISYDGKTIIHIFHNICEGIKYLHDHNLIHKDLRPENIYFTQTNEIKIDFIGLERSWELLRPKTPTVLMYPIYDAPENLQAHPYTKISNMWSLGVILYELCTLKHPFVGSTNLETDDKIFSIKFNKCPTRIPLQLQEILNKLLEKNVEERYTIDQVLNLPTLKSLRNGLTLPSDLERKFFFLSRDSISYFSC